MSRWFPTRRCPVRGSGQITCEVTFLRTPPPSDVTDVRARVILVVRMCPCTPFRVTDQEARAEERGQLFHHGRSARSTGQAAAQGSRRRPHLCDLPGLLEEVPRTVWLETIKMYSPPVLEKSPKSVLVGFGR